MSGSITANGITVSILVARTEDGFLSDRFIPSEEELLAPGVEGARWRTITKQFPDFELMTVSQYSSYGAAVTAKRDIEQKMVTKNATLTLTIGTAVYTMKKAHIKTAKATIVPGPVYGAGASGSVAHIVCAWIIKGTDFAA